MPGFDNCLNQKADERPRPLFDSVSLESYSLGVSKTSGFFPVLVPTPPSKCPVYNEGTFSYSCYGVAVAVAVGVAVAVDVDVAVTTGAPVVTVAVGVNVPPPTVTIT
jgi:hypothetical protein